MKRHLKHWPWLLLIPVVFGLTRIQLDVEVLNLLPSRFAVVQGLKLYQKSFSNARELILTVESGDPADTEHAARQLAEGLRAEPELVASANWQPPFMESPDQAAELIAFLWLNQPPDRFREMAGRFSPEGVTNTLLAAREELATSMSPDRIARRAYDPFDLMSLPRAPGTDAMDQRLFVSEDQTFRVIFIEAAPNLDSYRACLDWLSAIRQSIDSIRADRDISAAVQIHYTGRPAFVSEIAGGMERDIVASIGGTVLIIAALFYLVHRRWKPLLWLLTLLALILASTTALGGLLLGPLNVVSLGFAAILLGLAVDYGLVLYHESLAAPDATIGELRAGIGPAILWSAATTSLAFALLTLSGLPGLGQLGLLVAIGLGLAAFFMLRWFLPPLLPNRSFPVPGGGMAPPAGRPKRSPWTVPPALSLTATALLALIGILTLRTAGPGFDHTADALKPAESDAYAAVEQMQARLGRIEEPLWLLVRGSTEAEVADELTRLEADLAQARSDGIVAGFTLPLTLWPRPDHQITNTPAAGRIIAQRDAISRSTLTLGFNPSALALAEGVFDVWNNALAQPGVYWPSNSASRWLMGKVTSHSDGEFVTLGLVYPQMKDGAPADPAQAAAALEAHLNPEGQGKRIISGWKLMGASVFEVVLHDLPRILVPMGIVLLVALGLAFRSFVETLLSFGTMAISALALWTTMGLAGWSWNLINMMALPLLLGAGVDYSIHMQLGLRRHKGNLPAVQQSVGRALTLCAATTITAFASLAFSSNAGLASLGKVCAAGVACVYVTAVFLLPGWWIACRPRPAAEQQSHGRPSA